MCYQLPKIWMGRIQKYWDKFIPKGYPVSSSVFSLKYDTPEIKTAVDEMEKSIGTEDSPIKDIIPEGSYISNYYGVYNVDGTPGELTLLSPEKVDTDNVLVCHYNAESSAWEKVEDIQVINGYIWGTLDSFSPIAVFKFSKEIHVETEVLGIASSKCGNFVVCEGNPVKITYADGVTIVTNEASGKQIEVTTKTYLIGGSIDGTPIDKTNVTIIGQPDSANIYKIIAGSVYNVTDGTFASVGSINVYMVDTAVNGLTGSMGAVRTEEVNYTVNGSKAYFIGCGEAFAKVNTPPTSFASKGWAKSVNYNIDNCKVTLLYLSGNNEYYYVDNNNATITNSEIDYLISGGSNDGTNESNAIVKDSKLGMYQSTNRGNVVSASVKFTNCTVENLYVGGDASDSTVTGTTENISIEINAGSGSYNIMQGVDNSNLITAEDAERIVKHVKVSRNADVTISDELVKILGSKYIVK